MWKGRSVLIEIAKWGVTAFVAILISNYLITQLAIINSFLIILLTSAVISILVQAVRNHDNRFSFKMRWFVFYFLAYGIIILVMREYILSGMIASTGILSSLIIGFIISGMIVLIQKAGIRSHTIPWISVILLCILLVANLGYLQNLLQIDLQIGGQNSSILSEDKQNCPTPLIVGDLTSLADFTNNLNQKISLLNGKIDSSVWKLEHSFDSCYLGKYQGQYPDWIYCDNLITSRWETGSSGAINYRWYTAVSAEWKPQKAGSSTYLFGGFSCENGQKVTVTKGTTNYYVYDSRDGSKIRIAY
ncbi:MAG: hypothetical protein ABIJ58_01725 [Nanoarchaeota archaeon]